MVMDAIDRVDLKFMDKNIFEKVWGLYTIIFRIYFKYC